MGKNLETENAAPLALPLLTSHGLADDPVQAVLLLGILAMFVIFVLAMRKVERQLNDGGESLFHPWRVTSPRAAARRLDRTLSSALRALGKGRDEEDVLRVLHPVRDAVPGRARPHYDPAVARLTEAAGRDWAVDREARERALEEGGRALLMARAEALRAAVG